MNRVLVTGGGGYIGSVLVPELLAQNFHVTVIDNFMYRQNSLAAVCLHPHFDLINGDARDQALIKTQLQKADVVIPLAALVGAPLCDKDPVGASSINKQAALDLFRALSKEQVVLMPTTNSAYGQGGKDGYCDETSSLNPISLYAKDKVLVEQALLEHPNAVSFRLATVFGMSPRMRLDLLVNDFVYRAVNDRSLVLFEGEYKRNYIHVRDVASVFLHGLKSFDRLKGQIFNVGLSEANLSKKELCEKIQKQIPQFVYFDSLNGKDPDQRNYVVSNQKIEGTGWRPQVTLDQGIAELIKGYRMIKNSVYTNV